MKMHIVINPNNTPVKPLNKSEQDCIVSDPYSFFVTAGILPLDKMDLEADHIVSKVNAGVDPKKRIAKFPVLERQIAPEAKTPKIEFCQEDFASVQPINLQVVAGNHEDFVSVGGQSFELDSNDPAAVAFREFAQNDQNYEPDNMDDDRVLNPEISSADLGHVETLSSRQLNGILFVGTER